MDIHARRGSTPEWLAREWQQYRLDLVGARPRPVHRQISSMLEEAIVDGRLAPGLQLPSERDLATAFAVSRSTIVTAYRELESRGLIRGYVGRGTFVAAVPDVAGAPFAWRGKLSSSALRSSDAAIRDIVEQAANDDLMAVAAGQPAVECFPVDAFRQALDRVLSRPPRALWGLGHTEGLPALREAVAARFGGAPRNVLVVAGAQQGLDLLTRCLIDPGDTVVVDRPGYLGAIHTFKAAGARLVGWDIRRHDLDELEDLVVRYRPKLIYTNPTFQNPTGWTMTSRLRREVLELAGRLRIPIIEDDTYRELYLETAPPPPLHAQDRHSCVIHLNTFSKMLAPGLRLGWLSSVEPIVEQLALIKQRVDPHTHNLGQLVVSEMLTDGSFEQHLARLRAEHRRRRDALMTALRRQGAASTMTWNVPDGGLFVWCRLAHRQVVGSALPHALSRRVAFVPGPAFYVDAAGERELRLCFSSIDAREADQVVTRLLEALQLARDAGGDSPLRAIV